LTHQQRLADLQANIADFENEVVDRKTSLGKVMADLNEVEKAVMNKVTALEKIMRQVSYK
jgi:hypothetical protein